MSLHCNAAAAAAAALQCSSSIAKLQHVIQDAIGTERLIRSLHIAHDISSDLLPTTCRARHWPKTQQLRTSIVLGLGFISAACGCMLDLFDQIFAFVKDDITVL